MKRLIALSTSALLFVACQNSASLSPIGSANQTNFEPMNFVSKHYAQPAAYTTPQLRPVKVAPSGQVKIQGNTVTLELQLPPLSVLSTQGFKTQLLDLSTAAKISATVSDSYGKIYEPDGAVLGLVDYPVSGVISLTFNNVVPDQLLFVELQTRDLSTDIPQADLAAVVSHTSSSNLNTTLNFQTTPTAKAMKALLSSNATRARAIDLSVLNTLMTSITGYSAGPPATYTTHPSLVNTALLATDLESTDPGSLIAANYRRVGATVSLDISGLVGSDTLDVQVTDAASAIAEGLADGNDQLITAATPGTGLKVLVGATVGNSVQYNLSVSPNSNVTLSNAATTDVTIVATPATVTIDSLSDTATTIGDTITISGSGFSTEAANNTVYFGTTEATISSADEDELVVEVPEGISGSQPVMVEVGATTSNSSPFSVVPTISNLSASTGSTGDSITITGTGFSDTDAENTVYFGSVAATIVSATTTQIVAQVTEAPTGTANATVEVNSQTSNSSSFTRLPKLTTLTTAEEAAGKAVLIRGRTLTITGTNFDSTASNNTVRFTLANSTVINTTSATASATSLTVTVPNTVDFIGDVSVQVITNSQTSNALTGMVPGVTLNVTNGGFH